MRYKKYLHELAMHKDTKIRFSKKKGERFNAKITLEDGQEYLFQAETYKDEDDWYIAFEKDRGKLPTGDTAKIGLQIFAAVEKIVTSFIIQEKPESFSFTGTGNSRIKLYDLLAKKILKSGKYELDKEDLLQGVKWSFDRK